jgi:hypothetical protein
VLGQSLLRHAPGRPGAARLCPDAVQHRPVPARLPEVPGDRGSPAESARFLRFRRIGPDRPRGRAGQGPPGGQPGGELCAAPISSPSWRRSSARAPSARGQLVFADNCARCHSSIPESEGGPFRNRDFAAANEAASAQGTCRFPRQRSADTGDRGRHLPLPGAALESQGRPPVHGVRSETLRRQPLVADIPSATNSRTAVAAITATSRWSMSGRGAVHAQQRHRSRNLRQAGQQGQRLPPRPLRRRSGKLLDQAARLPALRPQRRGPLHALPALDARTAASEGAGLQADADQRRPADRRRRAAARRQDRESHCSASAR